MKTLTIKKADIASLDSDESKLEFVNTVIALLSGSEETLTCMPDGALSMGLNSDLPEPMEGAPDFDSNNMSAPEVRRYSFLRAGYVPKNLNCGYSGYEYLHLRTLSKPRIDLFWRSAGFKLKESKGKSDYVTFLRYLYDIYSWYYRNKIIPLLIKKEGFDG